MYSITDGAEIGDGTVIGDFVKLAPGTVIGKNCRIDDYVNTSGPVKIGDNVTIKRCSMIGSGCVIEDNVWVGSCISTTRLKFPSVVEEEKSEHQPVTMKKGSVIGTRALLLAGVTIGEGALVGAGAVVTKDCEPMGVYIGHPAKLVRYRNGAH